MISAENWCVKNDDDVFGPYTTQQLRKFVHEGRIAEWSLIAPAGSRAWREACEEPALSSYFERGKSGAQRGSAKRVFGRADTEPAEAKTSANANQRKNSAAKVSVANFIIVFFKLPHTK